MRHDIRARFHIKRKTYRTLIIITVTMCVFLFVLVALGIAQFATSDDGMGTVVFATLLHRHGDRSPTSTYPNDPYDLNEIWPQGLGQLTPIGREQLYELGSYVRERYVDLLPESYNVNDIYVVSSGTDRCLTSAECSVFAMYPRTRNFTTANVPFQPVPIHSADRSHDKIFYADELCPRYSKSLDILKSSPAYECVMNLTKDVRADIARHAGQSEFDSGLYSILFIEELYNLTLPDWTKDYYPEPMQSLYLFDGFVAWIGTKDLQKYSMGPFLGEVVSNMKQKSEGSLSPDRKLYVYSGHDATIYNALMSLDINNGILPPYASCLFIELRKKNDNFYVTVSYRNNTEHEPYLLKLPECDELCPLETFISLADSVIPKNFETECQEEPEKDVEFLIPSYGIPEEWLHCFSKSNNDKVNHFVELK